MTPSQYIRNWCGDHGYIYKYGNPTHINVWMGETDFSASLDGVCVFAHLLTASDYDPSGHDRHNLAIYFATLTPFDFDTDTIDLVTEDLHARAKSLLAYIQQGNAFGWEGARFQYGYDDYADNVAWCCLRVTLTALTADCVPMPDKYNLRILDSTAAMQYAQAGQMTDLAEHCGVFVTGKNYAYPSLVFVNLVTDVQLEVSDNMLEASDTMNKHVECVKIEDEAVEMLPALAPYMGKWVVLVFAIFAQSGSQTISLNIPEIDYNITCDITY